MIKRPPGAPSSMIVTAEIVEQDPSDIKLGPIVSPKKRRWWLATPLLFAPLAYGAAQPFVPHLSDEPPATRLSQPQIDSCPPMYWVTRDQNGNVIQVKKATTLQEFANSPWWQELSNPSAREAADKKRQEATNRWHAGER